MKKSILIYCLLFAKSFFAQVGINTANPNAQLEIKSSDQANPVNTDGILIPKVDVFPAMNPTIDQEGMLVYLTTDVGANLKGFYYWDNTNSIWKSVSGDKGWSLTGNTGTDVATNFIGTTDNVGLKFKVNNLESGHLDPILFNTSFGMKSANSITTGYRNSAIGHQSLFSNTEGYYNSAVGFQSMYYNTTGNDNSSFGALSLISNTSGNRNNAFGVATLSNNTTGNDNVALGYYSMVSNTTGTENVAVGVSSLESNTTGNRNVATGYQVLYNNTWGFNNSAYGYKSLYSNSYGFNNTAVGNMSMYSNTTGYSNVAIGNGTLNKNTTGNFNIAIGSGTLANNTTGNDNIANGDYALGNNTTGINNVAIGKSSLHENVQGNGNVACGFNTMKYNSNGSFNTIYGTEALHYNNGDGSNNNAFGHRALFSIDSGSGNCGFGEEANSTTTTGWNNIGIGFHTLGQYNSSTGSTLYGNEIGYDNIAIGLVAGDRIGNNCNQSAFIGPFSNVITNDTNVSNSTAIGNGALVFQNNMMRLGNSAVTRIETQVGLTVVSDGRYKYNVTEEVKGLDFIKKLRPVVYQYDTEKMDKTWMGEEFDTMVKHNPQLLKDYQKASQIRYSGFIAQEVETAAQTINYNFSGISKPEKSDGHYGLDYASFVVPIVKAEQELANENAMLKKQIQELENKNKTIELRLQKLESN
jgi:hypothetical protein